MHQHHTSASCISIMHQHHTSASYISIIHRPRTRAPSPTLWGTGSVGNSVGEGARARTVLALQCVPAWHSPLALLWAVATGRGPKAGGDREGSRGARSFFHSLVSCLPCACNVRGRPGCMPEQAHACQNKLMHARTSSCSHMAALACTGAGKQDGTNGGHFALVQLR